MRRATSLELNLVGWTLLAAAAVVDIAVAPPWLVGLAMAIPGFSVLAIAQRRSPQRAARKQMRGSSMVIGGACGALSGGFSHYVPERYVALWLLILVALAELAGQAWLRRQRGLGHV